MKYLLVVTLLFSFGCTDEKATIKEFIPGTYVHSAEGEFSTIWDTLTILPLSKEINQYVIKRCATYVDLRGVPKVQNKKEEWICLYKETDKLLFELNDGKVITVLPVQNALRLGKSQYEKIK